MHITSDYEIAFKLSIIDNITYINKAAKFTATTFLTCNKLSDFNDNRY